MDVAILEKEELPILLSKFEKCASTINQSRAIIFKIVDTIHRQGLLQKKSNYTEEQLKLLNDRWGMEDPWNYTTGEVLESLYSYFSWGEYLKFGVLVGEIDFKLASKMSEGALVYLNKHRQHRHALIPYIETFKDKIITRENVEEAVAHNLRKLSKKEKKAVDLPTLPKEIADKAKLKWLTKEYSDSRRIAKTLDSQVKNLDEALKEAITERNELRQEVRKLKNELSRYGRK